MFYKVLVRRKASCNWLLYAFWVFFLRSSKLYQVHDSKTLGLLVSCLSLIEKKLFFVLNQCSLLSIQKFHAVVFVLKKTGNSSPFVLKLKNATLIKKKFWWLGLKLWLVLLCENCSTRWLTVATFIWKFGNCFDTWRVLKKLVESVKFLWALLTLGLHGFLWEFPVNTKFTTQDFHVPYIVNTSKCKVWNGSLPTSFNLLKNYEIRLNTKFCVRKIDIFHIFILICYEIFVSRLLLSGHMPLEVCSVIWCLYMFLLACVSFH